MKVKKQTDHKCGCEICRQHPYSALAQEHRAINRVMAELDEKNRRRFAGLLALQWGRGSIEQVCQITGLSRPTIRRGRKEIRQAENEATVGRVRKPGAGRLPVEKNNLGS